MNPLDKLDGDTRKKDKRSYDKKKDRKKDKKKDRKKDKKKESPMEKFYRKCQINRKPASWTGNYFNNREDREPLRLPTHSDEPTKITLNMVSVPISFEIESKHLLPGYKKLNLQDEITSEPPRVSKCKRRNTPKKSNEIVWTVTDCHETVKPDKQNLRFSENEIIARCKPKNTVTKPIRDIKIDCSQIKFSDGASDERISSIFVNNSSSSDSDSADENIFVTSLKKNSCEIIKPIIPDFASNADTNDNINQKPQKETGAINKIYIKKINPAPVEKTDISNADTLTSNDCMTNKSSKETDAIKKIKSSKKTGAIKKINPAPFEKRTKNEITSMEITKAENISDKIKYFVTKKYCILVLKHPVKLYFQGKLNLIILSGSVEVLGHVLKYDDKEPQHEIYCPRGQCLLCFETKVTKVNRKLAFLLQNYNMNEEEIDELYSELNENASVIAVKNFYNKMSFYLEKHVIQKLYPPPKRTNDRPLKYLEDEVYSTFMLETPKLNLFKYNNEWSRIVSDSLENIKLMKESRTLICGAKGVGKSTLLRFAINRMLNEVEKVAVIDLDVGQPEFTINGCVSVTLIDRPIFGPNFTHLKTPLKSFFVGAINLTNCPNRYVASIVQLVKYCQENISKEIPWLINFMGFTQSIGVNFIVLAIKSLIPNIIIQIESAYKKKNYQSFLTPEFVMNYKTFIKNPFVPDNIDLNYKLEILETMAENKVAGEWETDARMLREMSIMSYFSQVLEEGAGEITAAAPYGIRISALKLFNLNNFQDNILAALNGALVALCTAEPDEVFSIESVFNCVGFGIVRGIDKISDELYLITPVPEQELQNVNSLILGNITLPPSIYMTRGHQGLVPYISLGIPQGTSSIPKRSFKNWKMLLLRKNN